MATRTRQQRRAEQRELRKLHINLRKQGLDIKNPYEAIQSLSLMFRDILKDNSNRDRVIKVATTAHRILDLTHINNPPPQPHACKAGCSYCCYSFTTVSAPEAFLIARHLGDAPNGWIRFTASQFIDRSKSVIGLDMDARFDGERISCPLLIDGFCGVYDLRPQSCRMYCSFDVEACKVSFEGGPDHIPLDGRIINAGTVIKIALYAALWSCRYADTGYELGEAVSTVLSTENALQRWTDGENIFANVQIDKGLTPDIRDVISQLTDALVG